MQQTKGDTLGTALVGQVPILLWPRRECSAATQAPDLLLLFNRIISARTSTATLNACTGLATNAAMQSPLLAAMVVVQVVLTNVSEQRRSDSTSSMHQGSN